MRKGSPPPPQQQQQQAPSSSSPAQKSAAPPSTAPSHHGGGVAGFTGSDFAGYRVGDPVGKGSMAQVRVAHHEKTGVKVAFKVISRKRIEEQCRALQAQSAQGVDSTAGDAAARGAKASLPTNIVAAKIALEVKVLSLLKHPHIIRLYDVIFTSTDVILVLEYASGGELFDYLNNFGRFAENQARALFQQLMSALEYCHANRVAHRDLKPENLLLDSGNWCIKLTDFDLAARVVDGQLFDMSCGTPNYAAPEVIAGQQYNGTEADTWSAGVVLFAMLTGTLPFDDEQIQTLFRKIREGAFKIPSWVSPPAKDLLRRMLVVDPLQRATIHQILAHPWLRTNIPRYIVDIHEACLRQASGIGVHDMVSQSGPYWDGYRHHVVSPLFNNATAPSATDGMPRPAQSPTKRRRFAQMLGSVDDFSSLHLQQAIGMDAPNPAESSLFPPPPTGVSPLDLDVIAHVADLWKSTSSLVEAAVHRAMLRREYDQTVQLHLLVHGRPPQSPPPLPPTDNSVDPTNDHDLLVTYVILRHRKRAEASTRHRDPAHSVSLGAEVSTSLREGQTASSLNQVHSASHAIDLQRYSAMANILGQGSLSGSLRPILVGKNAVAPAPSASITSVFTGGATAASFDALRMLDPASAFKEGDTTDSSRGSSHHATSKTVVVRQPPPLPEPVSIRIAAIPHYVYNGVARRPGLMQMRSPQPSSSEPLFGDARSPADAEEDVAIPKAPLHSYLPASTVPSVVLEMSAATRQQEEQQRQLGTLLDKPPQFAEYAGAAASEVWAQTFRLGVMSDELTAPSTFTKVFKVLKQQGYVWKVIRPYYVCAVCHCSKTKLFISLLKCSASVSEKFILDVRLAPCCPMSALWRVAETMEAFALSLSGPASIPQAPASLRRAAQQQLSLSPYPSAAIHQ